MRLRWEGMMGVFDERFTCDVFWEGDILGYPTVFHLVFPSHTAVYIDGYTERKFTVTVTCHKIFHTRIILSINLIIYCN